MMENVFDFLRAALPWIAVGLLLAVFFARSARKKKEENAKSALFEYGLYIVLFIHNISNQFNK